MKAAPHPNLRVWGCLSCLCGGFHGANECVVGQTHVTPGCLWPCVSKDGSDGQEVTGTCIHGGAAAVPEGVPGPASRERPRESLRDVPSREVPAVLPREQVAVAGGQGAAQVHADNRNISGLAALAGDVQATPVPVTGVDARDLHAAQARVSAKKNHRAIALISPSECLVEDIVRDGASDTGGHTHGRQTLRGIDRDEARSVSPSEKRRDRAAHALACLRLPRPRGEHVAQVSRGHGARAIRAFADDLAKVAGVEADSPG
uniref:Uncharacterized protein n=1 Tax=Siphoviridae sp. ctdj515 TaxID=2825582 RepID=A0A8S5UEG7_9CAUD|nr:MAG TPA: hypothetical protein [Siphoviridae sp. ctdj515]